ncbi:efflux transporter periplasmic adaptor subunit [Rubrivivax gelatinosus]|nr:efflux transporter periplasmic adaptor subunit [Rubrivivax gelatinosus]
MDAPSTPVAPRARPSWRSLAVAAVLVAVVAAALWAWRGSRASGGGYKPPAAIDVVALPLRPEPAADQLQALGELRAVRQVSLASEAAGRVVAIGFVAGQSVRAGAALLDLDDSSEQADLLAAQAAAQFARQQWQRAGELASTGAVARELLEQRRAELDQAAAQVQQLQARIRKLHLRAPFAGVLGLRQVDPGQYLQAGERIATLTDLDALYLNFDLPQQALPRLRIGQRVQVRGDAPGAAPVLARISAIEPQVGRDTRNASVQAELANPGRALRPGMSVAVAVELPPQPDALLVPATAVLTSATGDAAVVVRGLDAQALGTAEIVPIRLGRRVGERVLVEQGLRAGDLVVSEGQLRIRPGARVHVVPAHGASAPAGSAR